MRAFGHNSLKSDYKTVAKYISTVIVEKNLANTKLQV